MRILRAPHSGLDVVIVVGGAHDARELAAACSEYCSRVYHVERAADLRSIWFDGNETVGITAATATPGELVDEVQKWLQDFADFQEQLAKHLSERNGS